MSTLGAIGLVAFIATVAPAARSELPPPTADPHGDYSSETANCESCHTPHGSETSRLFVRSSQSQTCLRCHDGSGGGPNIDEQFQRLSTHPVADGTLVCSDCHTPHRSTEEDTKLLRAAGADGSFVYSPPTTPIGNDFCYSCHGTARGSTTPGLEGFDESAHNLHGDDLGSGSGIMCLTCHRPHGSNNLSLLTEDPATLCLQCHAGEEPAAPTGPTGETGPAEPSGPTGSSGTVGRSAGTWGADRQGDPQPRETSGGSDAAGLAGTPVLGFGARANDYSTADGTPIRIYHHPISPDEQQDGARSVTCSSCHNPHLADATNAGEDSLVIDPADTMRQWDVWWRPGAAMTRGSIDAWCATCHVKPRRVSPIASSEDVPYPVRLAYDAATDADGTPHDEFTYAEWTSEAPHGPTGARLACTACHDFHGSSNAYMLRERVVSPDGASTSSVTGFGAVQAHWDRLQTFCSTCHTSSETEHGRGELCTRCHSHTSGRL